ncbi:23S rRNA (adenine(2030)-N(6))-methyltransferase RlmJ [Deltaproteobacteria bacterium TL4]
MKHTALTLILSHLKKKETPFCYYDTHAGAGCYDLRSVMAKKKEEFQSGIIRLWQHREHFAELSEYFSLLESLNHEESLVWYPGSPMVAAFMSRPQDVLQLMELHSTEFEILKANLGGKRGVSLYHRDGFQSLIGLTPPKVKRGIVLIDPAYEDKKEYALIARTVTEVHKKWSAGIFIIWYPLLANAIDRSSILMDSFQQSGLRKILRSELWVAKAAPDWGMHGSGILVVNPPWHLNEQMQNLCNHLTPLLAQETEAGYRVEWLVPE